MAILGGMATLLQAATRFTILQSTFVHMQHASLEAGAQEFLRRAQAAIGTYEYGWAPLAASTIARKARGDIPLLETSEMRDSGGYTMRGNDRATVGFTDWKIVIHEYGVPGIPPRPVVQGTIDHHMQDIAHRIIGGTFVRIFTGTLGTGTPHYGVSQYYR